jgi:hypothetical protein
MSQKPPTRSAWLRLRCCRVGWIAAECAMSGHAEAVSVRSCKPPSCGHGGRSTRPWWYGFWQDVVSSVVAGQCRLRLGVSTNHTRAGTVPDRRGRCGMHFGLVRLVSAMPVKVGSGALGYVTAMRGLVRSFFEPSSCRHGAGSTPAAWDVFRHVNAGWVMLGQVWARFLRHRGRRGEASTPRGVMRLVTARLGKVRRGESRPGTDKAALVIGTTPLRRGGAEWKGAQDGRLVAENAARPE